MNYQEIIRDFAIRTRQNLEFIEMHQGRGESVFEVTQLVNSMLGLLVFPQQRYYSRIPTTPLAELVSQGWPDIKPTQRVIDSEFFRDCRTLRDLVRYLRNAISHFNLEFIPDHTDGSVRGLRLWNIDTKNPQHPITWETELSITDLRLISLRFIELLEKG